MRRQVMAVVVVLVGTLLPGAGAGAGGVAEPPVASAPATVEGDTVFRAPLVARRGRWLSSEELRFRYQWLRGGREIAGATDKRYRPGLADLGRRLRVRVTATDPADRSGESTSAPTDRVRRAELVNEVRPTLSGTRRYTRLLT
ncbi:MAG: hypothetical protein ACXWDM_13105, partial [Nocardioides sp.]